MKHLLPVSTILLILAISGCTQFGGSTTENCGSGFKLYTINCLKSLAIETKNISICDNIQDIVAEANRRNVSILPDIDYVERCKGDWYAAVPKTREDIEICNSTGKYMETCFESIAVNLTDPEICEMIETRDDWEGAWWAGSARNACIQKVAWETVDKYVCNMIDFESLKESCISSINNKKERCQRKLLENPPTCGDGICEKEEDCYIDSECFDGKKTVKNCPYGCGADCSRGLDFYKCISDSDGGKNINQFGYITTTKYDLNGDDQCMTKSESGAFVFRNNECSGDSCFVLEYFCEGDIIRQENIACPTGCKDGECQSL